MHISIGLYHICHDSTALKDVSLLSVSYPSTLPIYTTYSSVKMLKPIVGNVYLVLTPYRRARINLRHGNIGSYHRIYGLYGSYNNIRHINPPMIVNISNWNRITFLGRAITKGILSFTQDTNIYSGSVSYEVDITLPDATTGNIILLFTDLE